MLAIHIRQLSDMAVVESTRVSTCIWLLLQLLVWSVEGDYEMSVTVHSFLLLDSRCALCYGFDSTTPQLTMSCCDAVLDTPCRTADCDIKLRFCPISEGLGFDGEELSTPPGFLQCESPFRDGFVGYNVPSGEMITSNGGGVFGDAASGLVNPVTYTGEGGWEGAELTILVYDRDHAEHGDFDDVVDVYQISVEINPGSTTGQRTYTGRYNYTRLELEIKVICVQEADIDENCFRDSCQLDVINCNQGQCINSASGARCECMPGFTGEFCTEADKCATNDCQNGTCISESDDYRCDCFPGYSGVLCDVNIDDCAPESCNGRGDCVDEVQNFSCVCFPGFTGERCEIAAPGSSSAVIAIIAGGVAGGVVVILLASVIILILVFVAASRVRRLRIKRYNVQGNSYNDMDHGSPVPVLSTVNDDIHIYDVATTTAGTNSNTSATPGEYQTIKNFINPLYTDNSITEIAAVPTPEYDSPVNTQPSGSCTAEQEEEEERNVVNLIYNDDNEDGVPTTQGMVVEYDKIGNVYHTLENEQDRAERYILIARAMSTESESASGDLPDSSKEHSKKKPPHSYEDVPL